VVKHTVNAGGVVDFLLNLGNLARSAKKFRCAATTSRKAKL
jgi:hypothetical protein